MDSSLRDYYEKKIRSLELDNILLQEQLITKPRDDYQLKYELLLAKTTEEHSLRESKRTEDKKCQEKGLEDINNRWKQTLNDKTNELNTIIDNLQNQNKAISIKNTELEMKAVRLQREIDEGDSEVLKLKFEGMKKENERLRKQIGQAYAHCDNKLAEADNSFKKQVEDAKEREKISYRTHILELEKTISELELELQETRKKASPEREANLRSMQEQLAKEKGAQSQQILNIAGVLEKRNKEVADLKKQLQQNQQKHATTLRELNSQLKAYEAQLFQKEYQKEMELTELQREMGGKREKQAEDLKEELRRAEESFERQRFEWKSIIEEFQTENKKIKKDWQEEKQKYMEEKSRLKEKIMELRGRLKEKDEALNKEDNEKMAKSLKDMDQNEEQFTNYENAITFMDRQVKKSLIKLQEKDRQINALLEELKLLQEESQKEIKYTREKARNETNSLYDKIFKLEDQVDQVQSSLKDKERWVRSREKDLQNEKESHKAEVENLRKIIEEMQRDYERITSHKKSLEESYREERENVLTGKIDINQERKKKWKELAAQKHQMELVYKEKVARINDSHEIQLDKLKTENHRLSIEKEEFRAEVQVLKERLDISKEANKENVYTDYQAKLATLDLEIALTQNLFQTLTQATSRMEPHRKTELDEMSEEASQQLSSEEHHHHSFQAPEYGGITPNLTSGEMMNSNMEPFRSAAFSFFPPPKNI